MITCEQPEIEYDNSNPLGLLLMPYTIYTVEELKLMSEEELDRETLLCWALHYGAGVREELENLSNEELEKRKTNAYYKMIAEFDKNIRKEMHKNLLAENKSNEVAKHFHTTVNIL